MAEAAAAEQVLLMVGSMLDMGGPVMIDMERVVLVLSRQLIYAMIVLAWPAEGSDDGTEELFVITKYTEINLLATLTLEVSEVGMKQDFGAIVIFIGIVLAVLY